jgi:hypothetical protein
MGRPALVGREEPLRRLTRALDETFSGIGRLVLISGEPGVGKTRLALEALDSAAGLGARCAVGACWDGAGAPGLWPWVQILRSLRADLGPEEWDRATGSPEGAVDRLLDADHHGDAAEFHLLESILHVLTFLCDERPLVVLLEDLHWADPASVSLMTFLHRHAVHLPFLMIGTYRADEMARADHPLRDQMADLAQAGVTIPLSGLDNDGIRQVRELHGVTTSTAEAEHLRRLTGGNPFFVIESLAFTEPAESLGIRRAVDRRVDALDDVARRVLTAASLIGRESDDRLVSAVVGVETSAAYVSIEQSGLMSDDDTTHVFVHDLVRETMRDRLAADDRRAMHATIVGAADTHELRGCLLPSQLAWFASQAVPDIAPGRAVALLETAAGDALARLTYEEAGRHLELAAGLSQDDDERTRLTLDSAHAYERAGALASARDLYASLLVDHPVEVRSRALLGLHRLGDPAAGGAPSEFGGLLDAIERELADSTDTQLRAELLAARSRSRSHLLEDDRSFGVAMATEALDLARSVAGDDDDEATLAACLLAYHDAIWEPGTEKERRALADELATVGRRRADPSVEAQGLLLRMVAEIEDGDEAYEVTHGRFDAVAESSHSPRLQFVAASRRGMVAALRAHLGKARTEIDAARALGERIGEPDVVSVWCDQRWQVARHAGDLDTIAELLATLRDLGDPHWMVYEAMVATDLGDRDRARWVRPEILDLGRRWPRWAARLWDAFDADLAIAVDDRAGIDELIGRLTPDAGHWAVLGGGVIVHGPVSMRLGRLEAARGNLAEGLAWAVRAEAEAARLGAVLWQLEACADRLTAQHALGTIDVGELTSTISSAAERGLVPLVQRLQQVTPGSTTEHTNVFRRDHDVWTLTFDGLEVRMPDAKGLRDLHTLLANPGVEVPATSLATDAYVSGDAAPVLDGRAKAAYRRRLDDLDRELDRAALRGDAAKADTLERERQALIDELRHAAGLGGRDRTLRSDQERLRKTVTARIRDTLRRLDDRHPALAEHLRSSVRTGAVCTYSPALAVHWELDSEN